MAAGGTVGETAEGFTPLSLEEARALVSEDLAGVDRDALLAERAEAEAQLRAAEATLEQEREEPTQKPLNVEVQDGSAEALDLEALRMAAAQARAADDELARAASEASERPLAGEVQLGTAESAFARALEIREELPATWRRLVGALISATGMAIVVGALGWSVYWLLVPIALIAILTVDLRLAGKAIRENEAALALASVGGGGGVDELERVRTQRTRTDDTEARLNAARAERDAAYDRFEELAPGRLPSEVDEIIAELEAEQAARAEAAAQAEAEERARAEAEAEEAEAAQAEAEAEVEAKAVQAEAEAAEPEAAPAEPEAEADVEPVEMEAVAEAEPVETEAVAEAEPVESADVEVAVEPPAAVTASEWWFGTKEAPEAPAAAAAPVRALAERLSAEGREALARIQAQLDTLDRVELAKKSLEWHEANGSAQPADTSENAEA